MPLRPKIFQEVITTLEKALRRARTPGLWKRLWVRVRRVRTRVVHVFHVIQRKLRFGQRNNKVVYNDVVYRNYNLGHYYIPQDCYGGTAVDIGANVGSFLEEYGDLFSKLHYYEANPVCFAICEKKKKEHMIGFNLGVYKSSGETLDLLVHANRDSGSCALKQDGIEDKRYEDHGWSPENVLCRVKTVDLETVIKNAGGFIDYLKIDCETGEYHILNKKDLSRIKYIGIELSCQLGPKNFAELLNHIKKTHEKIQGKDDFLRRANRVAVYQLKDEFLQE